MTKCYGETGGSLFGTDSSRFGYPYSLKNAVTYSRALVCFSHMMLNVNVNS